MKTYFSSIASAFFVLLGCIQPLSGAVQPDSTLMANPSAVQLHVDGTATNEISISSDNGFDVSAQLTCQNLPLAVVRNFTPTALQLQGATAVSSQLDDLGYPIERSYAPLWTKGRVSGNDSDLERTVLSVEPTRTEQSSSPRPSG